MAIILADNLTKTYSVAKKREGLIGSFHDLVSPRTEEVKAVKQVSFAITEGELVGFIGPNGAGKTTTLKMLSGLLHPTSGKVSVLGENPWDRSYAFLSQISLVMGQKNQLWWDLPARESFSLVADIYGIPKDKYKHNLNKLVEMLEMGDFLNVQVRKLSLGQRMKAELIAALLHSPKVLFLDEPTIGLDVLMQQAVRKFIKEYNAETKGAIILTSHYMEDVKELCKRVIVINHGEILFDGLLEDIVRKFSSHKLVEFQLSTGSTHSLKIDRDQVAKTVAEYLKKNKVIDINIREIPIEEVISSVFSRGIK